MKRFFIGFAVTACLAGCVGGKGFLNTNTPPDAGKKPENVEALVKSILNKTLKDPYSVRDLSISDTILDSCEVGPYGPFNAWVSVVSYNEKNSYGAYVGLKTYYFRFHGNVLKGINQIQHTCHEAGSFK